jgi:hypothetical protein
VANRNFNRKQALEKEVKELYLDVAIGMTGAPTLTRGTGVASIARTGAGEYTITLQDKYMRLMAVDVIQQAASAEDLQFQLSAESVASAKTVGLRSVAAGVATDPSNGSRLLIRLDLKNSSVV